MTDVLIWTTKGQINPIVVRGDLPHASTQTAVAQALRVPVSRLRRTPEGRTNVLLEFMVRPTTSVGVAKRSGVPTIIVDFVSSTVTDGKTYTFKGWIKRHGLR